MPSANFVTVEMLEQKLLRNTRQILRSGKPVGLHAWPKCRKQGFCGIGLVDWGSGSDPEPLGDVFVGKDSKLYHDINRKLHQACKNVGVQFISMA